jgi:hypothetical protein
VKKRDWYYTKVCKHAKNQKLLTSRGCEFIATQITHGVVKENARKVVQFAIVLHLLQQGRPMLKYEVVKSLFKFMQVPKNNKKHESDNSSWTMAKFMFQEVLKVTKAIVGILVVWLLVVMKFL